MKQTEWTPAAIDELRAVVLEIVADDIRRAYTGVAAMPAYDIDTMAFSVLCEMRNDAKAAATAAAEKLAIIDEAIKAAMKSADIERIETSAGVFTYRPNATRNAVRTASIRAEFRAGSPFAKAVIGRYGYEQIYTDYHAPNVSAAEVRRAAGGLY